MRRVRRRTQAFVGVGLLCGLLGIAAQLLGAGAGAERSTVDARFDLRAQRGAPRDIAVVAIDSATLGELNERWPFRRSVHGAAIDALRRLGAREIVYDVQFTEQTIPREDNALINAVARARGKVVLATTEVDDQGHTSVFGGDGIVRSVGARVANAALPIDGGGVFRRVPYSVQGLQTLAVVSAEAASGRRVDPAPLAGRGAWIDYAGPPETVRTISFVDVLRHRVAKAAIKGRVVVVGATAPTLQDVHPTSIGAGELMSGAEIQASAIETVLHRVQLRPTSAWLNAVLILLLGIAGPLAMLGSRVLRAAPIVILAAAALLGGAMLAFSHGWIVPVVIPAATLALASVAGVVLLAAFSALERERTRTAFSRFVPEAVVNEVLAASDDTQRLAGVRRTATVLFADLRGFTAFAEHQEPDRVIAVLNRYLTEMSEAILDNGGTLVSYMGDGVMAVFGAPLEQPDHADRALAAAAEMSGLRLARFNAWIADEVHGAQPFRIGIGVNSGPVMSGNVGSPRRLEYAAVGDTTNTAARLEAMTADASHDILLSDATRAALTRPAPFALNSIGDLEMRGRVGRVTVWAPAPASAEPA